MKKQSIFGKIVYWILEKFGVVVKTEVDKKEMCRRAVDSGVCPKNCENCAWNRRSYEQK